LVYIFHGQTSNTVTIANGTTMAMLMGGPIPIANVSTEIVNGTSISGQTLTVSVATAAAPGPQTPIIYRVNSFMP
jgi:hypothetical protein